MTLREQTRGGGGGGKRIIDGGPKAVFGEGFYGMFSRAELKVTYLR